MTKCGKCRCGTVLRFEMTSLGYKTRCPDCKSVVRLRSDAAGMSAQPHRSHAALAATVVAPRPGVVPTGAPVRTPAPPPLNRIVPEPDFSDPTPPPLGPVDFSILETHPSSAPVAVVDLEAYLDCVEAVEEEEERIAPVAPSRGGLRWWLLAIALVGVMTAIGVAAWMLDG